MGHFLDDSQIISSLIIRRNLQFLGKKIRMIFSLHIVRVRKLRHRDMLEGVGSSLGVVKRRLLMMFKKLTN